jgi:two-component system NtrC family sensor kinase
VRALLIILSLLISFKVSVAQKPMRIDSFSQVLSQSVEDSLKRELLISRNDSNRVLLLHWLSYTKLFSIPDSAMYIAQEGSQLSDSLNFPKGQALCKADIGGVWWIIGDYSKANEVMLQSLRIAESLNDPLTLSWALALLTSNNRDQGNYTEALRYAFRGMSMRSFNERLWNVIVGSVYEEMNKLDSALFYLEQGDSGEYNYLMLGHTYAKLEKPDIASSYYKNTISAFSIHKNLKDLVDAYIGLARINEKQNKFDSAVYYADKGLKIAQNASFKKWVFETSLILSRVYERKDMGKALLYYKLATEAKDNMFNVREATEALNTRYTEQLHQRAAEAAQASYKNKIRIYVLLILAGSLLIVAIILFRNNREKQKAKIAIETAYRDLKSTQAQLIQSEKMASLGELTAGIAHEIQNPLNFVNNFSDVNSELVDELEQEIDQGKYLDAKETARSIKDNEQKINHHGKRADTIVKGMLQHSRTGSAIKEPSDINRLADEYLRLAYQGFRARDKSFNATFNTEFDNGIGNLNVVPQEIGRVILNLINNAFYAVNERSKQGVPGYEPTVIVGTRRLKDRIEISVKDNGNGVPGSLKEKIFQPFFTTKPTGQGTGLGLSLAYDIVKAHGGERKVETKEGEGSKFIVELPIR